MSLFGPPDVQKLAAKRDLDGLIKAMRYSHGSGKQGHAVERVRREAAKALGQLGDARAVEPLGIALHDEDETGTVAGAAFLALGKIGDARAVELMAGALNGEY